MFSNCFIASIILFGFVFNDAKAGAIADDTTRLTEVLSYASKLQQTDKDSAFVLFTDALSVADDIIHQSNYSEKVLNDIIFRKVKVLNDIANYYYEEKYDYDKALEYFLQSIELAQRLSDNEKDEQQRNIYIKVLANSMLTVGAVYFNKADYPKSLEYYNRSLGNAIILNDSLMQSKALLNLGMVYNDRGMYSEAVHNYYIAIGIFEKFNDKKGVAICNLSIGSIMRKQNSTEKAIESYTRALEIFEELKDEHGISSCYNNLAICYAGLKNYEKALGLYNKSLELDMKNGREVKAAFIYNNIAALYEEKGEYNTAISYVRRSMQINKKYQVPRNLMGNYLNLSGAYLSMIEDSSAVLRTNPSFLDTIVGYGKKGLVLADSLQLIVEKAAALDILQDGYSLKKNYREAYRLSSDLIELRDSIYNSEKAKVIAETEAKYEDQKKEDQITRQENRIEDQQLELNNARRFRNLLTAIIVLMIVVVFLVYYHYTQNRKANKILDEKNNLIERQNSEITQQKDKLQVANQQLTELIRFKEKMTGMIVHDLKNPLNNILNSHSIDDISFREQLIRQSGFDMLNLTQNILDVYRLEESQITITKEPCNLFKVLQENTIELALYVTEKHLTLDFPKDESVFVYADKKLLKRIFSNLLGNAVKYAKTGSTITVRQKLDADNMICFGIHNFGPAIPPGQQVDIFKRFRQYDSRDMGVTASTGLGLSFCKMAVELHDGKIGVISDENGTEFWFTMPQ